MSEISGADSSARPHGTPSTASRKARVLIADDDRDTAATLAALLGMESYEVFVVHGGQEALDAAREFKPDAVLLDIGMPKVTGYEVARRLRQRHGDDCPSLIALTGWKQPSDKILATLAGFDHHVAKPYDTAELFALLARLTHRVGQE